MAVWSQMNIQDQWFDTNGDPLSGGVLKVYDPGGLISTSIAIDSTGASPQASITLNANGQYEVGGSPVLPFIDRTHKWGIFANATDAAADTPFFAGPFDSVPNSSADTESELLSLRIVPSVDDYAAIRLLSVSTLTDNSILSVTDVGIAREGVLRNDVVHGLSDNGGTIIVIDANWWWDGSSEVINIKHFGAIGDGVTDDTAFIQAAFTYQNTDNIPIYIPASSSDYLVSGQLEYYGHGLYGDGRIDSAIKSTYVGVLIKKMNSNDEGVIRDFTLRGNGRSVGGVVGMGADGSGAGWFRTQIKNVHFREMERQATIEESLFCIFDTWYARSCVEGLFFIGGGAGWNSTWYNNGITFINCLWDDCSSYAVDFVGSNLSFSGTNTFQSGGDGIRIDRDPNNRTSINTLDNLYFEFNTNHDIKLDGTDVTLGPCMFQSGPSSTPLFNILANDTNIYSTGRPSFLDVPDKRISLTNGSQYISMHDEIVSSKIVADATSEYIYIPTRLADKTIRQTITDLTDSTPVELNSGSRMAGSSWKIFILSPNSETATASIETSATGGLYRMTVFGRQFTEDSTTQFTLNQTTDDYVFTLNSSTGDISVANAAVGTITGDTIINLIQTISESGEFY